MTNDDLRALAHVESLPSWYPPVPCKTGEYVYFIQCVVGRAVKVGRSKDPGRRLSNLQMGCPFELRLVAFYWSADGAQEENRLHEFLRESCGRGEWHHWSPTLEKLIAAANEVTP